MTLNMIQFHLQVTVRTCSFLQQELIGMKKYRRALIVILTVFMFITQQGCSAKTAEPVARQNFYFDTVCSIAVYDMDKMSEENANKAIQNAFALCSRYESLLSRTKEGTDIYRINNAGGEAVECDPETVEVIRKGLYYSELSEGKFDITIGKVSDLWDFHTEDPAVPSEEALKEAAATVGWQKVRIENNTVALTDPGTHIDLGGIAKGYIADRLSEQLRKDGVTSGIISLGGNIACIGSKGSGSEASPFRVGIEKPYSNQTQIVGIVEAADETVVTSGVYQRYFEKDGVQYHHILDATTGLPAQSDVVGVTLKAADGKSADCDALATILLIMGEEKAMKMLEEMDGFEAFFILEDGTFASTDGMGVTAE